MITIRCEKCRAKLKPEYSMFKKKCETCGNPILNSANDKAQQSKINEAAIKKLQKLVKKDLEERSKQANKKLKDIQKKGKLELISLPQETEVSFIEAKVKSINDEQHFIIDRTNKAIESIANEYNENANILAKDLDLDPHKLTLKSAVLTKEDIILQKQEKMDRYTGIIGYILFFGITPLGMVMIDRYILIGSMLILGGVLSLPAVRKKILSLFGWLKELNLILITNLILSVALIKLLGLIT